MSDATDTPVHRLRRGGWKRRIAKACDRCRARKTKCDGARPVCRRCMRIHSQCEYQDRESHEHDISDHDVGVQDNSSLRPRAGSHALNSGTTSYQTEIGSGHGPSRLEQLHWGTSSAASLFNTSRHSRPGAQTPDIVQCFPAAPKLAGAFTTITAWKHPVLIKRAGECQTQHLPPWSESLALVNHYFETFNSYVPVLDHPSFLTLLGQHFTGDPCKHPSWSACINTVIAIALRDLGERSPDQARSDTVWRHIQNALDVILEVTMFNPTIMSIQALTLLAWFFLGTRNPQPSFMFAGTAVRMGHAIGLHDRVIGTLTEKSASKAAVFTYWAAGLLESHVTFRTGRPSACDATPICDRHCLGEAFGILHAEAPDQGSSHNRIFRLMLEITILRYKIRSSLFTAEALSGPLDDSTEVSLGLVEELDEWKRMLPVILPRRQSAISKDDAMRVRFALLVHLGYHDCKITATFRIWQSMTRKRRQSTPTHEGASHDLARLSKISTECVQSARATCELLQLIPTASDDSFCWEIVHHPMTAVLVILVNLQSNPMGEEASKDRAIIDTTVRWLLRMEPSDPDNHIRSYLEVINVVFKSGQTTRNTPRHLSPSSSRSQPSATGTDAQPNGHLNQYRTAMAASHVSSQYDVAMSGIDYESTDVLSSVEPSLLDQLDNILLEFDFDQIAQSDLPFPWNT